MNVDIYLFGKFKQGYRQYPGDDQTKKIFTRFCQNLQAPTQIVIHRDGNLMYYGYVRKLKNGCYIGFCVVVNGLLITDIKQLFKVFEDAIDVSEKCGLIYYNQHLHELDTDIDELYSMSADINTLDDFLRNKFKALETDKLPAVSYGSFQDSMKEFREKDLDDKSDAIIRYSHTTGYTFVYKDKNYDTQISGVQVGGVSTNNTNNNRRNHNGSNNNSKTTNKTLFNRVLLLLLIMLLSVIVVLFIKNKPLSNDSEQPLKTHAEPPISSINEEKVDKAKVEKLIQNICKNSSKGGNYSELEKYYTPTIQPYYSEDVIQYTSTIAKKTKDYVERFPKYEISDPYDFKYKNSSFPLTVVCTVQVEWINKGKLKKAIVYKTFYITEDYKVSGYLDETYYLQ